MTTAERTRVLGLSQPHPDLPSPADWDILQRMAKAFAESGLYPNIKNVAQAIAVVQSGRELGVPAGVALRAIRLINGVPTSAAELMGALVYRDHGSDALRVVEATNDRCVVRYKRREWSEDQAGTITFTMEDAERAGLLERRPGQQGKSNWEKFPRAMLRSRAISEAARTAFQDSILGLYTAEEIAPERVTVTEAGDVVLDETEVETIEGATSEPAPPVAQIAAPAKVAPLQARGERREAREQTQRDAPAAAALGDPAPARGAPPAAQPDRKRLALEALRAWCTGAEREPPQDVAALNALAREVGLVEQAGWSAMTEGWIDAIHRALHERWLDEATGVRRQASGDVPTLEQTLCRLIEQAQSTQELHDLSAGVYKRTEDRALSDEACARLQALVDERDEELKRSLADLDAAVAGMTGKEAAPF